MPCSRIIKDKHHSRFDRTIYTTVPWINIQGQWLEQAGFAIHTP
ncbi:type I toxin-antitoxin system SymE family toxin, partial [candidate division KSB1 bacterium]|nr:type I toxin-antitoxin system SymE family toxin [Phycisphaerae bacterium]NIR48221.1 type I toxin-antitoxin system SymE family toxin [candidate division KSB1 bacterium]NIS22620.1 type I toxin-antitoxin system SymE family toxin [candidate division KSB1 bacterium]NIT69481.1 type I toxin-antitoxin system SymE family toxin [candidate division KSB1 bacterium]NIU24394.1 type I toxin-antitoxin system SymE family toxin [candidate division KSB1 bacterium]